jgi:hypothetical protein
MKFNHTDTMKDDNKPEAPEGYTVIWGNDIPGVVPPASMVWDDSHAIVGWNLSDNVGSVAASYSWYAVPIMTPNTDPKASQAVQKPQLQLIPPSLNDEVAKALSRGAVKYGPWNWRDNKVELMTYLGAMKRHIDCLIEGEDIDPDTGAHHLGCVAAGCGIVLDARKHGTLVDNRPLKAQNT